MIDKSVSGDAALLGQNGKGITGQGTEQDWIAVIGIGCRFPGGADGPRAFWKLLCDGVDAITEIPAERFDVDSVYDPQPGIPGKMVTRWGGFLKDVDKFDASFFRISPREASSMDPQQRLLLEVAWEALEDAGQVPEKLVGSRTGVFLGMCYDDYIDLEIDDTENIDIYVNTGGARSVAAGRISYALGLQGPSLAIDTACSSSLVAVHLACQSIHNGESAMALAGGINLILQPEFSIGFSQASMLAPDGRCKAFDASANGFVRSDGVGLVLLKPFAQAQADGDPIYAVIRGGAVNNDGRSGGFLLTPSQRGQEAVLRDAYTNAGLSPSQVHYIEAHGTGTSVGDPIEAGALGAVIAEGRAKERPCLVGSVKTNIGHTEAASGIAGLIKVALSLKHGAIPANLHLHEPNPKIPFDSYSIAVQGVHGAWPVGSEPARGGVSSFGINGTNAHLVLEEAPAIQASLQEPVRAADTKEPRLLTLSAQSPEALKALAESYRAYLSDEEMKDSLSDICFTASVRRSHHEHRLALVARSREELTEALKDYLQGTARGQTSAGRGLSDGARRLVFVFPGQGSQWLGMGRELLRHEPAFRASMQRCAEALGEFVEWSLLEQINLDEDASRLGEIDVIQPTLFAIQVSLVALWRAWGIEPDAVVGQSMGEVAAACVAGAISLRDAARIICRRSRLLRKVSGQGGMAVVGLSFDQTQAALKGYESKLSIAVSSSPLSTVVSGDQQALEQLIAKLEAQDIFVRPVKVDIASHSPQMEPLREELLRALEGVAPQAASVPVYSTVTGRVSDRQEFAADYWVRNLREPVLFSSTVERLIADGHDIFVEISPNPVVLSAIQQTLQHLNTEALLLSSMQREEDERAVMLGSLGSLYAAGQRVDWNRLYTSRGRCVRLPSYPWQRERFWIDDHGSNGNGQRRHRSAPRRAGGASSHLLLGDQLRSAVHAGTYFWETELSVELLPYLADHRVQGMIVLPAAAYAETALAAARAVFGEGVHELEELSFKQPLFLPEEGAQKVQVVVSPQMSGTAFFQFFSLQPETLGQPAAWSLHTTGIIRRTPSRQSTPVEDFSPEQVQTLCHEVVSGASHYEAMQERGLQYGESFRAVEQVWRRDGESLGRLSLAPALQATAPGYSIHPALLDACFQVVAGTLPSEDERIEAADTYVPIGIGRLSLFAAPAAELWSHARLEASDAASADTFHGDVFLYNEEGAPVLAAHDLRLQRMDRAGRGAASRPLDEWLYEIAWERTERTQDVPTHAPEQSGNWLIFADRSGVGRALKSRLETLGERVALVFHEESPEAQDSFYVNPNRPEDFRRLLKETEEAGLRGYRGVVHLWSMDAAPGEEITSSSIETDRTLTSISLLHLVQALSEAAGNVAPPRLWLVSRGVQRVESDADASAVSLSQSPVWGLGRVIANEHPELRCAKVDLGAADAAEIEALLRELCLDTEENEIVLRGSERYVARLVRCSPAALPELPRQRPLKDEREPFRLEVSTPGILDNLILREIKRRAPGPGEVEIEVRATGLNFRDVMLALGLLPPVKEDGPIDLGWECSGIITALGEGVRGFEIGDEVLAVAPPCFSSYAVANSHLVVRKPAHLSFEEAATIPVAYITAHYSFQHMGRLREGERVLIHAASGAVGIAAVQLAQWLGAEVFATAGSPEKREFLKSLGVKYVMDSRSLDFAEEIMRYTDGEGVDVVLNSIAGEAIPKSLSIMRLGGRFLELGKTDILQNGRLALKPFERNLAFFAIDLSQMFLRRPAYCGVLFREVMQYFTKEHFQPPPLTVYPLSQVVNAFHFMARAGHIGKLVISIADKQGVQITPSADASMFESDATYLITGGLGGLGLTVARWMVAQGARHLVLMGRSGASAEAEVVLDELREAGASVLVARADVAQAQEVAGVLARIRETLPPLRGVLHAAAVLDDGILLQLDAGRFRHVMSPKIGGAWNLHHLTRDEQLDFFVLFSSAASMLGSPGQGNYVAANAFLDALARQRRAQRLPVLCLNWGPWAEVGLAARPDRGGRLELRGVGSIAPQEGLEVLGQLLRQASVAEVGVMPFDLQQWSEYYPAASRAPIFARLAREQSKPSAKGASARGNASLDAILGAATEEERRQSVETYLQEQLAKVLRLAAFKLDVQQPINKLGLDSLMAVELKNRIQNDLGVTLPVVTFLKGPSLAQLASQVLGQLVEQDEAAQAAAVVPPAATDVNEQAASHNSQNGHHAATLDGADATPQATTGLDDFSDDEVDSLLSNMLAEEDEFNERDLTSYR